MVKVLPDLSNWREYPHSQWAFQHVREILPTALIAADPSFTSNLGDPNPPETDLWTLPTDTPTGSGTLLSLLEQSHTDGLLVLHHGNPVGEWHAPNFDRSRPHILFSISKSLTSILAGILQGEKLLDPERPIDYYLPGVAGSVYAQCSVRQLLDMTVALNFEENYTDPQSEYVRYRIATGWNPANQLAVTPGLEEFLYSLQPIPGAEHGDAFLYRSPNSDLLGLLVERISGLPLADVFSNLLWQPMEATSDGYVTLDRNGLARAAGGICVTLSDLARVGQLLLQQGSWNGRQIIPADWVEDTFSAGNQDAWNRGNYRHKLPHGKYRSQWYQIGDADGCLHARGIHGQLLYINPARAVVIARLSSQPEPLNDPLTTAMLAAFQCIAEQF